MDQMLSQPFGAYAPSALVKRIIGWTRRLPQGWWGRRLSFGLRRLAVMILKGAPVDTEVFGARMRLYPYRNVCEKRILFTPQSFDPEELAALKRFIHPDFTFLDIGANVGGYALFAAAHSGAKARILAIEPQPAIFERLVANIRANPFATLKAMACAVADKPGELDLFIDDRNFGGSSIKIIGSGGAQSVRVPAKTLLTLLREEGFDHVDAIKLDVEGAEDIILEPFLAEASQSLWPRLIILERGEGRWQIDLLNLLAQKGYVIRQTTRLNHIIERHAA